ncbi:hypothetical protein L1D32_00420 [Shewanella insulae]|uniref:hypothetical protein n=1 Tax=Shewanella insulae TaxID=2681496 RepID=UPI001EFD1119|nr:hypothetical protein [Shewanella insulae]MCG9736634.1 hypothetical protein [Shewanella insulae]
MQKVLLILALLCPLSMSAYSADSADTTQSKEADSIQAPISLINDFHQAHKAVLARNSADFDTGVTAKMAEAIAAESALIMDYLIPIESYVEGLSKTDTRRKVERDCDAIAHDAYLQGHQLGWGGTGVVTDVAEAKRDHLLNRLVYYVVRVHKEDDTRFDLDAWLAILGIEIFDV